MIKENVKAPAFTALSTSKNKYSLNDSLWKICCYLFLSQR